MKIIEVLTIASLFLIPGAIAPAYAEGQEKQPEQQAKPAQQQQRAQQPARPAQQPQRAQQPAKPALQQQQAQQPARPAQQQQRAQQPAKPAQQQQRAQQPAKPAQQQQRAQQAAKPAQQQQRAQQQARPAQSAQGHGRIPDDRFRASFGRGHTFHVNRSDFLGGSRRFEYGGFWFAMVNPWPDGWLYTDNVYVDYINGGYFLCDPFHPGVYLSITVG
jgi:outer membrane biosynthesis protein TonB